MNDATTSHQQELIALQHKCERLLTELEAANKRVEFHKNETVMWMDAAHALTRKLKNSTRQAPP